MLDDAYFVDLGEPPAERIERLPLWAADYINALRRAVVWWQLLAVGRHSSRLRPMIEPKPERVYKLPLWAVEWINTLRFDLHWYRDQAFKAQRPLESHLSRALHKQTASAG